MVKSMRETLGKIQDVLAQMRALAVEAANNPNADRKKMNLRFERMKKRIDLLAAGAANGSGLPKSNLQNVQKVVSAVEASMNSE